MTLRSVFKFLCVTALLALIVGCSGGSGSSPVTPVSVSFLSAPPSTLNVGTSAALVAVVSYDSSNAGVSWKVSCGSSSCGTIAPPTTASGSGATYTAPAVLPSPATVTVTATSVADNSKSASATITITATAPPPAIAVSLSTQPSSTVTVNGTTTLAATVDNDAKNAGVTWKATCGSTSCGTLSPSSTNSGIAVTYTAPAAVPTPAAVTLTATSVTDITKSASATVTITPAPTPVLADGTYVFHLSGQDVSNSPYYVAGAFSIRNGTITAGEQDFTDTVLGSTDPIVATQSSITATNGNVQIVLATANNQIGVNGAETLRGTVVSGKRMLISQFDSFASATGSIDLQTSVAPPSQGYVFAINGTDATAEQNQLVLGGVLTFQGSTLSTTGSVLDYNDGAAAPLLAQGFSAGSITAPDAFGRVTISLTPNTSAIVYPNASATDDVLMTGYLVDGSRIELLTSQTDKLNANLGGTALAQNGNTNAFTANSVANTSYVYGNLGQDSNGSVAIGGSFTFASGGSASGTLVINDLQVIDGDTFSNATYTVNQNGRVTISNILPSQLTNANLSFILYLDGNGNALALGADDLQQTTGRAYRQTAQPDYAGNFAVSAQGFLNGNIYNQPYGAVGPVLISSDVVNGFTDYTSQDPNPQQNGYAPFDGYANTPLIGTENANAGTLNLNGLNSLDFNYTTQYGIFPIDTNRTLAIEIDPNGLGVLSLENLNVSK